MSAHQEKWYPVQFFFNIRFGYSTIHLSHILPSHCSNNDSFIFEKFNYVFVCSDPYFSVSPSEKQGPSLQALDYGECATRNTE